eukprot:Protomagalhaensia_sp_Gyna_25__1501@NODE_176_length_4608_cov_524_977895_g138_i0_p2_GENE_NODE_176_length_4608_cov_524_977895_g138_i0NODE_176_length_4608_cov_524_977895_g138_i0_p2_ORF_typecomplete_len146_score23_10_NODE_176_length_4608_cov_524_977895_g138_i033283765
MSFVLKPYGSRATRRALAARRTELTPAMALAERHLYQSMGAISTMRQALNETTDTASSDQQPSSEGEEFDLCLEEALDASDPQLGYALFASRSYNVEAEPVPLTTTPPKRLPLRLSTSDRTGVDEVPRVFRNLWSRKKTDLFIGH